jgi:hypothetical protein
VVHLRCPCQHRIDEDRVDGRPPLADAAPQASRSRTDGCGQEQLIASARTAGVQHLSARGYRRIRAGWRVPRIGTAHAVCGPAWPRRPLPPPGRCPTSTAIAARHPCLALSARPMRVIRALSRCVAKPLPVARGRTRSTARTHTVERVPETLASITSVLARDRQPGASDRSTSREP